MNIHDVIITQVNSISTYIFSVYLTLTTHNIHVIPVTVSKASESQYIFKNMVLHLEVQKKNHDMIIKILCCCLLFFFQI